MKSKLLRLPPLDALRGFVAAARRLSITAASQDLCLTQSAVSRQIIAVEDYMGTPLMSRKYRGIALTEAGKRLMLIASPFMDQLAEFADATRNIVHAPAITIAASPELGSLWLLSRIASYQQHNPGINMTLVADSSPTGIARASADLALLYAREGETPHGAVKLFSEAIIPVAGKPAGPANHTQASAECSPTLLEFKDQDALDAMRWSDWLKEPALRLTQPATYLHCDRYDELIRLAINGHGAALGRIALVFPMLQDGTLVALPSTRPIRSDHSYWLVDSKAAPRREVMLFRKWLLAEAAQTELQITRFAATAPANKRRSLTNTGRGRTGRRADPPLPDFPSR
ncbi:MAG: LysR family transcriptional regulator [Pseudomonadota bacterium]